MKYYLGSAASFQAGKGSHDVLTPPGWPL